jgi:RNA-directed DNA polymerase
MISDSPHLYRRVGLQGGYSRDLLDRAIAQSTHLEQNGYTSVLTLKHLAWQTGASYRYLREIVQRQRDPYTEILRRRRDGKAMRLISAPDPPLMATQRWILHRIVERMPVHGASYAYMPHSSIIKCAKRHVGAAWLIKLDVHNFFHSIDERQIFRAFADAGYNRLVAFELARVCTRGALGPRLSSLRVPYYNIESYRSLSLGALPQGAPTSGALSNVIMYSCDNKLAQLATDLGLTYTRYADDIVFSGSRSLTRSQATRAVEAASLTLKRHGFAPHNRKTRISPPGSRKIVLGLLVDGDTVRLSHRVRQQIADHIRGVRVFGLHDHARHFGFTSSFGFVNHVNGLLAFAHDVDEVFATASIQRWSEALGSPEWKVPFG